MIANSNDRRSGPERPWDPDSQIINSDIAGRISRLAAAVQFVAHGSIAMEGPMCPVGVADVGYVLELMGEEGQRICNDIDRLNGGV